ncbi:hypothetical protein FB45DRAFT_956762 [Roridomyces roridus]|uniref:Uncharacterized protein n=1 Tax=Roridomyces roridus TaxID=1738132 RepID=A0AAD7AYK4_9AGAR|nr:hypothetical protein FB45DRAFT_956762 [Roridomyces roridus]
MPFPEPTTITSTWTSLLSPTTTSIYLYRGALLAMTLALGYLVNVFKRSRKGAQQDLLVLRKAIEERDTEVAFLHRSVEAAREDAGGLAREVQELRRRLREAEENLADAGDRALVLESDLKKRSEESRELTAEKVRVEAAHAEAVGLLEARSIELAEAQAALQARAEEERDSLTDQAVLALVHAFNTEIKETAAFLADSFEFEEKKMEAVPPPSSEMAEVHDRATEILGPALVDLLLSTDHHSDSAIVRIAFQGGIVEYARWMSGAWFFEDPEDEQLLADIYQRVRAAQTQSVAGRWRALTHRHVQELIHGTPELADYFIDAIVNVLLTAGFKSTSTAPALHELVAERFSERIDALVKLAVGLNRALGVEVTACELKALAAPPGSVFDAETMDSALFDPGEPSPNLSVLCTLALGLSRADKIDGVWTKRVLLKPTVVLPSDVDELLEQGQSTPTKTKKA